MTHILHEKLLNKKIHVALIGAGGTGSRMLDSLVNLDRAMRAKGHPEGLHVTLIDDDTVSPANVGRQAFYDCDIGTFKADTLINRANMATDGTQWVSCIARVTPETDLTQFDIVIGAVDNRLARKSILEAMATNRWNHRAYYLDMGNRTSDGQVVLGEVWSSSTKSGDNCFRLPHIGDLFPELLDESLDGLDDGPSCSLAEALEKQSLFINPTIATMASSMLWNLLTKGEISVHGAFVNLDALTVMPIQVDLETWARFGYKPPTKD